MKQLLLLLAFAGISVSTKAQTLGNPDFENWDAVAYDAPVNYWITSNYIYLPGQGLANVTKVTGNTGLHAIRLQTYKSGNNVTAGFITNTLDDIEAGEGGRPYISQPTHFEGFYRYSLPGFDTAVLVVMFKNSGMVISRNIFKIKGTGNQPAFTSFKYTLFPMTVPPDTVIIAAMSSNLLNGDMSKAENGSFLELDGLEFTGIGWMDPIPNGGFEDWSAMSFETPADWDRGDGFFSANVDSCVKRSTDKYSGTYALQLDTRIDNYLGFEEVGIVSQQIGLNAAAVDSIVGYYKYTTPGTDTAMMNAQFVNGSGTPMPMVLGYVLPPVNTYTRFALAIDPADFPSGASGLKVSFQSSSYTGPTSGTPMTPVIGSRLLIDGLSIAKQNLAVRDAAKKTLECSVYPNPTVDDLRVFIKTPGVKDVHITLYDLTGKIIYIADRNAAENIFVPVAHLTPGNYYYTIKTKEGYVKGEFTKK